MSREYDNTNTGMLSRNKRKEKETHPTHQGFINVEGVEYWLSAWVKEGRPGTKMEGEKFFSLTIKPKEARQEAPKPAPAKGPKGPATFEDDDIPF